MQKKLKTLSSEQIFLSLSLNFHILPLQYLTTQEPFSYELPKIKGSKFIGYLFPIQTKQDAETLLIQHRKTYYDATHHCYAYRVGVQAHQDLFGTTYLDPLIQKSSDDGEPTNTAGKPLLSVMEGEKLHNSLLIATRYFGGTLLGVGGLIQAYTQTAKQTIANAPLYHAELTKQIKICYPYEKAAQISQIIKKYHIKVLHQERTTNVKQTIEINYGLQTSILQELKDYLIS